MILSLIVSNARHLSTECFKLSEDRFEGHAGPRDIAKSRETLGWTVPPATKLVVLDLISVDNVNIGSAQRLIHVIDQKRLAADPGVSIGSVVAMSEAPGEDGLRAGPNLFGQQHSQTQAAYSDASLAQYGSEAYVLPLLTMTQSFVRTRGNALLKYQTRRWSRRDLLSF